MTELVLGPLLRHVGSRDATIWVETDGPCEVTVLGHSEHTWTVAGHHYALVVVDGLEPGTSNRYDVRLDGAVVWPLAGDTRPQSRVRTMAEGRPVRIAFGSCRYASSAAVSDNKHFDSDVLDCYSRELASQPDTEWPEALLLLGDQVYADETSDGTRQRIAARRDINSGAKDQVADFEEYTWLYSESWTDPDVRWLLSTVPSSMIFDDHDIRDDWNTSELWRSDMKQTSWWSERIIGGLSSYWVYQHLGNLSPILLAENALYQKVRAAGRDVEPMLRDFAAAADAEADGEKGTRWSYRRDFGNVRLLMIDSRCGRILAENSRSMISRSEFDWISDQMDGDYDHLLIGTSLPWLLARALHDVESWNELLCSGVRGPRIARWSEKFRRAADLEHWASFRKSFDLLADLLAAVGRGEHATQPGQPPATICVVSGDVHHAYVAQAQYTQPVTTPIYQLTCSPLHNYVPAAMKVAFRLSWSRLAERLTRLLLGVVAKVPPLSLSWTREAGPFFGDEIMTARFEGRRASVVLEQAGRTKDQPRLRHIARIALSE